MEFTGERYIPGEQGQLRLEHIHRYLEAARLAAQLDVLDLACGEGYGSEILAETAKSVIGMDASKEAITHAKRKYKRYTNLKFIQSDATILELPENSVDMVTSFETIEHIGAESQNAVIKEIARVLRPDGFLIISSPNKEIYNKFGTAEGGNAYHLHELEFTELDTLLRESFSSVSYYVQEMAISSLLSPLEEKSETLHIWQDSGSHSYLDNDLPVLTPFYHVAICSKNEKLPHLGSSAVYPNNIDFFLELQKSATTSHRDFLACNQELGQVRRQADEKESRLQEIGQTLVANSEQLDNLASQLAEREREIKHLTNEHGETLNRLTTDHQEILTERDRLEKEIARLTSEHLEILAAKNEQMETLTRQYQETLSDRDHRLTTTEGRLADHLNLSDKRQLQIDDLTQQLFTFSDRMKATREEVEQCKEMIDLRDNLITSLSEENHNKQQHISMLLETEREYERFKQSRGWRVARMLQKASGTILPLGSKRRLFVKTATLFLRYPIKFMKNVTPTRIKTYFHLMKTVGPVEASRRLSSVVLGSALPKTRLDIAQPRREQHASITDYGQLIFPRYGTPVVSIVIPVHNQFNYTYKCLQSILRHTETIPYEVILGDDCSSDLIRDIEKVVRNITVVRNPTSLQFIRNCNHAAESARGEYILFLNNDTQVQENWLQPLIELMEKDPKVGIVGSKLVFPDGTLQEAGGLMWRDGSAWNYGRGEDAAAPDFNYVRETDYVSGASLMIRRGLWSELGGFDEEYVPAYCEDSDLAFRAREKGYRVLYQPLSVVVHYEGISNGTDVSTGAKAYQVTNQKKFFQRWKAVLERDNYPTGECLFRARGRSRERKMVLMVDHYVPEPDRDAGSRTVFHYIKMMREMNLDIIFVPENFRYDVKYTQMLQQLGVLVVYGDHYAKHWKGWLEDNGSSFDFAFLNRPHIAVLFIDAIRKFTKARIVYYGHDLHHLREERQYQITSDPRHLVASQRWKGEELALVHKSDISYFPSEYEVKCIKKLAPNADCNVLPINIFDDIPRLDYDGRKRKGLLFVGGFQHTPNVDGIIWFVNEIMPILRRENLEIALNIVGSKPPQEVMKLSCSDITVLGYVDDDELARLYNHSRMCVAPLRFGAGVKGKVIEAMYKQVPLVTTPIGAEGMPDNAAAAIMIKESATDFACAIMETYNDFDVLRQYASQEYEYVCKHYSRDVGAQTIKEAFSL